MEDWLKCQISPLVKYRQNQAYRYGHFYLVAVWIEKSFCLILSTISQTLFIMWESICTGYISLLFFITQVCPKTSRKSQYFRGQCVQTREKRNTYTNVERPGCIHGKYWHWSTDTGNISYYALVECIDLLESLKTCNNSSLKLHMYLFITRHLMTSVQILSHHIYRL